MVINAGRLDSMGHEIHIDRILYLEKQIEESAGDTIKLKRARNSLLNISTIVPPEILGSIFLWNVTPSGGLPPFGPLPKGTYDFLLVCRHWSEVASHTPELWSFWGNTLEKWSRWYKRSGTTPVDLVLSGCGDIMGDSDISFDGPVRDALRDRAARDAIRSLHLWSIKTSLVTSILSTLTTDSEEVRYSSIESISLQGVDISKFFARYRFPKLWYLDLSAGITISSWEDFGSRTTALTTLSLTLNSVSSAPTTPQLLSILASNPRLQTLALTMYTTPPNNKVGSAAPVPLRHLKKLTLMGDFHTIFQLMSRLDHPETMSQMTLVVFNCTVEDTLGTLGPYIQEYIQRDGRFRYGLGIHVISHNNTVSIDASAVSSVTGPISKATFATFTAVLQDELPLPAGNKLCIDLVAYVPKERVVYFGGDMTTDVVKGVVATMPTIRELHLTRPSLVSRFLQPDPDGPLANQKLLPSLQRLRLENAVSKDWSPIIPYLRHQTSEGQRISLTIEGLRQHICRDVLRRIEDLVEEFDLDLTLDDDCPLEYCSVSEEE